jgi:hypothetical protein
VPILRTVATIALLLSPVIASAANTTTWSFLGGEIGREWRMQGQAVTFADIGGLRIKAQSDTQIFRETALTHDVDAVEIVYMAPRPTEAVLLWRQKGARSEDAVQLPLRFDAAMSPSTLSLDVAWYREWYPRTELLGLQLPAGADIQILRFDLLGWTLPEQAAALLRSYGTLDDLAPTSVNFLWGPILTPSPLAAAELYEELPPRGRYANIALYAILLIALAATVVYGRFGAPRKGLLAILGIAGALWIVSDVRMGVEILSYLHDDIATYWSRPEEERIFRERADFRVFLEKAQVLVANRERYIFMTQYPYPLLGLMRYHTYPALPVAPQASDEGVDTWVVYDRPDITLNEQNQLAEGGRAISRPGTMLLTMREGTFVFRSP